MSCGATGRTDCLDGIEADEIEAGDCLDAIERVSECTKRENASAAGEFRRRMLFAEKDAGYPRGCESDCICGSISLRAMANAAAMFTLVIVESGYASTARTVMALAIDLATCIVLPAVDVLSLLWSQSAAVGAAVCDDGVVDILLSIQVTSSLGGT